MGVLSGLSTTVQLHAPQEYRGRVLSFFLVALGVAYPVGALLQGPVADAIGASWTTIGAALALALACAVVVVLAPRFARGMAGPSADEAAREPAYSPGPALQPSDCPAGRPG